jgi:hypothetical protein
MGSIPGPSSEPGRGNEIRPLVGHLAVCAVLRVVKAVGQGLLEGLGP